MGEMMKIQKERVRKELVSLCLGEFTAVLSIWFCFFLLKNRLGDVNSLVTILYPLSLLTFILLQGSIYWAILIRRLSKPQFGSGNVPKLYGVLRILDLVLLISGFPFIVWYSQSVRVAIIATLIQLFALIEWVNYFLLRLSYSLNPLVLWKRITKGKLEKSRIAKELG
ncbi:hypothetical protein NMM18_01635 [Streptococcus oralis]|uniref:Uncharacterized protein n=2 Tax=Streptococcus TaxID=1301 RepID=A0A1L8Q705_STROR|nr:MULTISPECIES: hypothetical protein [Streptococcus]AQA09025.1 putative membrane protein [Streptococcus oralis]MBN6011176.1 hypothetical protein [Streptococcus oralis subsp. oralis]MCP9037163.1 hypothetical protein [Streptococcus oralis]MCP9052269.1 hypothetical protein [Streptococcus oralis]MCP9058393.1 hypothetical protein [Streptococcus oralis]